MKRLQGKDWDQMKTSLVAVRYEESRAGHIKGIYRHVNTGETYVHWLSDSEELAMKSANSASYPDSYDFSRPSPSNNFKNLSVGDLVEVTTRHNIKFYGVVMKLYPEDNQKKDRAFIRISDTTSRLVMYPLKTHNWKRYCCDDLHGYFAQESEGDCVVKVKTPYKRVYTTRTNKRTEIADIVDGIKFNADETLTSTSQYEITTYFCPRDDARNTPGHVFAVERNLNDPSGKDLWGCCITIDPFFAGDVTPLIKKAVYKLRIARLESKL